MTEHSQTPWTVALEGERWPPGAPAAQQRVLPLLARYVRISVTRLHNYWLALTDVEIFGLPGAVECRCAGCNDAAGALIDPHDGRLLPKSGGSAGKARVAGENGIWNDSAQRSRNKRQKQVIQRRRRRRKKEARRSRKAADHLADDLSGLTMCGGGDSPGGSPMRRARSRSRSRNSMSSSSEDDTETAYASHLFDPGFRAMIGDIDRLKVDQK